MPVGIGLLLGMALLVALGWHQRWWANLGLNLLVLLIMLWYAGRSKTPVTGRQSDLPPVPGSAGVSPALCEPTEVRICVTKT